MHMSYGFINIFSGSKYIGEWYQDLKHGRGRFVFQSGQVFEGQFLKDKMVGGVSAGSIATEETGLIRPQTPLGSLIGKINLASSPGHSQFFEKIGEPGDKAKVN